MDRIRKYLWETASGRDLFNLDLFPMLSRLTGSQSAALPTKMPNCFNLERLNLFSVILYWLQWIKLHSCHGQALFFWFLWKSLFIEIKAFLWVSVSLFSIFYGLVLLSPTPTFPRGLSPRSLFNRFHPDNIFSFDNYMKSWGLLGVLDSILERTALGIWSHGFLSYCISKRDYSLWHSMRQKQKTHHK